MDETNRLLAEVGEIYEAALDPNRWQSFLQLVAQRYPGCGAYLWLEDKERTDVSVNYGIGTDPAMLRSYEAHYASVNPWSEVMLSKPAGHVNFGPMLVPEEIFLRSEFYNDWLKPQELRHGFGVNILSDDRHMFFFSICTTQRDAAGKNELRLMGQLLPHLQRAARVYGHISHLTNRCSLTEQLLAQVQIGTIVLDARRKLAFVNREAERIMKAEDGLKLTGSQLQASFRGETRRLHAEIEAAFRIACGQGVTQGGTLAISRPSGLPPFILYIIPFALNEKAPTGLNLAFPMPVVAIFISDPTKRAKTPQQVLREIYGLTAAEARMVQTLVQGASVQEAADIIGVAQETVRSHLKAVFLKTGTHSQADLVRRVLSDLAGLPDLAKL